MPTEYPSDWDRRREEVYERDGYECQNCGRIGGPNGDVELHAHHVVPKASGGTHQLSNLTTVCDDCHRAIHNDSQAPTAVHGEWKNAETGGHSELLARGGETNMADRFLFQFPARFTAIRALLIVDQGNSLTQEDAEAGQSFRDDDRDLFDTTHQQFGWMWYARMVYCDAHADVLESASIGEPVSDALRERYTLAENVLAHLLDGGSIEQDAIQPLIESAGQSNQPHDVIYESLFQEGDTYELQELDTVHEMVADWKENQPKTRRQFEDFVEQTEALVQIVEDEFELYRGMVVFDSDGVATISAPASATQKRRRIEERYAELIPEWYASFLDLSNKGLKEVQLRSSERYQNWKETKETISDLSTHGRLGLVASTVLVGGVMTHIGGFVSPLLGAAIGGGIAVTMTSEKFVEWLKPTVDELG